MTTRRLLGVLVAIVVTIAGAGCGGSEEARPDLAFVSTRDGDYAIFEMNADGGAQHRLTPREVDASSPAKLFFQVEPAWSPDGSTIAFSSRRSGTFDLYVMSSDGTGAEHLTSGPENDSHPSWSPDARRLTFQRDGGIYVLTTADMRARRVSEKTVEEGEPAWSPDGAWIAYVRRTPGTPVRELWITRPDGSDQHALTAGGATVTTPAWSPDSSRIVFSTNQDGEIFELYTVGVDGKGIRSVTPTAGDMFEPSWSPDGSKIAFSEGGSIFTVELGGGDVEKLTDTGNNDSSPAWNPSPPKEGE